MFQVARLRGRNALQLGSSHVRSLIWQRPVPIYSSACSYEYAVPQTAATTHFKPIKIIAEPIQQPQVSPKSKSHKKAPKHTPEKTTKPKFERTPYHEIFLAHIRSKELEKAEKILIEYIADTNYSVSAKSINLLLGEWIKANDISRAFDIWKIFSQYGIRRTVRSHSLILNGLIHSRRTSLLPTYMEAFERSKIKPAKLLSDRFYHKETTRIAYTLSNAKSFDPKICLKLPPSCPLPDGTYNHPAATEQKKTAFQKQIDSEKSQIDECIRDYQKTIQQINDYGRTAQLKPGRKLMVKWFESLRDRIQVEQKQLYKQQKKKEQLQEHREIITKLSADKLTVISIHELLSLVMLNNGEVPYTTVCTNIGRSVQAEIRYAGMKKELKVSQQKYIQKRAKNTYQRMKMMKYFKGEENLDQSEEWTGPLAVKVGSSLIALLLDNAQIEVDGVIVPAFTHDYISRGKRKVGIVRANSEIINQLDPEECQDTISTYNIALMPMYVSPQPWEGSRVGPYFQAKSKLMRTYCKSQETTLDTADLSEVCKLLTLLGKVPWQINSRVFKVVNEGWERGGNLPYIPSRKSIQSPTPPEDFRDNPESRLVWRREKNKTNQKNQERFSLRCDFLLKRNTAQALAGEESFYFPHNMDFRGRAYPIPPHLNHIGSDLSRGILQFAEGRPLGERGLFWLKAHLASLCGVNKVSFVDRVKFTEDHIDDIIDSAENPLEGNRWWVEADDAWQCLACCFELYDALRMADPTKYISHMPIHMDGSCNGLQHYAALGGDIEGGRSVNLLPADKPQDVYRHVLNLVTKKIDEDADAGNELAEKLRGKIIRKTIKQTVMTSVYGVTKIGARKQIAGQLRDQEAVSDEELFAASLYVTQVTFDAMQSMFTGARQIMAWLADTAHAVSRTGTTMAWKTPIGIPVEQHYRKPGKLQVKTLLQSVILTERIDDLPVLVQKQRSAFPPNYVHSLDSTHMFKTAKKCNDAGITFAAVHDSFWTHANSVDSMNVYLRDAFVELHSRPLLQELVDQIAQKHPSLKLDPFPERGPLDITLVKDSNYFFH